MQQLNVMDRLYADVAQKGPVCVGLDTKSSFLPAFLKTGNKTEGERIFEFNRRIIDATHDVVGCYKVQIACYEALGLDGLLSYARTVQYARAKGSIVISDVKRGDISSTAGQYAKAHFSGDFETDFVTTNAYMGEDAVSPYYSYFPAKGMFALVKTSNASSGDIQDLKTRDGRTVYQHMAAKLDEWGRAYVGECGFSCIGAVTGCTYPEEFDGIRNIMPNTFLLIPGYGAQGGTGRDIAAFFRDGIRGVVNSSRALLTAHSGKSEGEDFVLYTRAATVAMREDILTSMHAYQQNQLTAKKGETRWPRLFATRKSDLAYTS